MTEREALVAAIAANPDDDTPRLIFADWLQENGEDDRAEFIRLQCELAHVNVKSAPANGADKFKRVVELVTTRWQEWMSSLFSALGVDAPDPPKVLPYSPGTGTPGATISCLNPLASGRAPAEFLTKLFIDRGFVTGIDIHTAHRKRPCSFADAFCLEPITSIDMTLPTDPPNGRDLLELALEQVRTLNVQLDGPDSAAIPGGLAAVFNFPVWSELRHFSLATGRLLPASCAREVIRCDWIKNLRSLCLSLGNDSFDIILRSPLLRNLESLDLTGSRLSPETIARFAKLPYLAQLKKLNLSRSDLTHRHISALASSQNWDALEELNLASNSITNEGAFALVRSPILRKLRRLVMAGAGLGVDGILAIAKALDPERIESINFAYNNIEPIFTHSLRARFGDRIQLDTR
jgi:uncharacterized protein (TIGR02996 family)